MDKYEPLNCKKYNISYSRVQYRMKKYNYTFEQAVQEVL